MGKHAEINQELPEYIQCAHDGLKNRGIERKNPFLFLILRPDYLIQLFW